MTTPCSAPTVGLYYWLLRCLTVSFNHTSFSFDNQRSRKLLRVRGTMRSTLHSDYQIFHTDIPAPTIYQLTEELVEINDWYSLGVALMVPLSKLEEIQKSTPQEGIQRWRINLLQYWLNSTPSASWRNIVAALEKIGHHTLSAQLRDKYMSQTTTGIHPITSMTVIINFVYRSTGNFYSTKYCTTCSCTTYEYFHHRYLP